MSAMIASRHVVPAVLGVLLTGAVVAIGIETDAGRKWRADIPAGDRAISARTDENLPPPFTLPAPDTGFKETVERPLWVWTRRPSPAGSTAQAMKKGQFKLAGTSVNKTLSVAYLVDTATGKTVSVMMGKEINGITLDLVEAGRVVLKQGDDTEELRLATAPSPKIVAPPPVPGQPGQPPQPGQPAVAANNQFYPPGMQPQPGTPIAGVGQPLPPGVVVPPTPNPAAVAAAAAAAAAQAAAGDQPAARRRRFQNLPQQ